MKKLILTLVVVLMMTTSRFALAAPPAQSGTHTVAFGETLSSIAVQYGVSVDALMQANGLLNPDFVQLGTTLFIPGRASVAPVTGLGCGMGHTVLAGDTLSSLAVRYQTDVGTLMQLNGLRDQNMVRIGQTLCVPNGQASGFVPPVSPANSYYHTVQTGETLSGLAARYDVSVSGIMIANGLRGTMIVAGQQLVIPGYTADDAAAFVPFPPTGEPSAPVAPTHAPTAIIKNPPPAEPKANDIPPAPGYQAFTEQAPLPRADHPIMIEILAQEVWNAKPFYSSSPDGTTVLVVATGGSAGKTVRIRSGDYEVVGVSEFSTTFGANRFVFAHIPPGDYDVWIDNDNLPSVKVPARVEEGEFVSVEFKAEYFYQSQSFASPSGWVLQHWSNPSEPGKILGGGSNLLVRTPASGLKVNIETSGGYQAQCFTGNKGAGACDFAGMSAGTYIVSIENTDLKVQLYLDGHAYAELHFAQQPLPASEQTASDSSLVGPYFIE